MYGIHLRGVYELRQLGKQEMRSVDGEEFATAMQEMHEKVKQQLEVNTSKYTKRADVKKKEVICEVEDLVFAHLLKERFPKRDYNKQK